MNLYRTNSARRPVLSLLLASLVVVLTGDPSSAAPQARYQLDFGESEGSIGRELIWRRALHVERGRPVLEAWAEAGPQQRAQMVATLDEGVDPRRSRKRLLPVEYLSRAWRTSGPGADDAARAPWLDLIDSVDLRVLPGVFNARSEGRGEALTVRLTPVWNSLVDESEEGLLEVTLIWSSATGEETIARRERAEAANLESGFDMYIRPPISEPGMWGLTLEVDTPAGLMRSGTVPVECVRDLPGLVKRLAEPSNSGIARQLSSRIELLQRYGIRLASETTISSWVATLDERASVAESSQANRAAGSELRIVEGSEFGVPGEVFWQLDVAEKTSGVLLILSNKDESAVDLFHGPHFEAWRELAQACGLRIVTGHVPVTILSAVALTDCVAKIKKSMPGPVYLLGRGRVGQLLPSLVAKNPGLNLAGLIQSELLGSGGTLPDGIDCPALQIVNGLPARDGKALETGEGNARRTRKLLLAQHPVAAFEATQLIQTWIQSL